MDELLITDVEDDVVERLQQMAEAEGVSLEEICLRALRAYVEPSHAEVRGEAAASAS